MSLGFLIAAVPASVDNIPVGMPTGRASGFPQPAPGQPGFPQLPQGQQPLPRHHQPQRLQRSPAISEFIYPLAQPAPVTSNFGWRIHPVYGDRRFHSGVDLGAPMGTPVLAAGAARVKSAGSLGGYGLTVVLEHWDGTNRTLYAHLSEILVGVGQMVQPGQVIGKVGSTGRSTGPHLHFEVRRLQAGNWVAIDADPIVERALESRKLAFQMR
jgi:murein DD-endopeptidase MepM/ murein hydrolase activator NlpD